MVKNFLVVVMMEHGRGPNDVTVMNINTCENKKYSKNPKFSDTKNVAVIILKFKQRSHSIKTLILSKRSRWNGKQ